jgi:hypothetical protein
MNEKKNIDRLYQEKFKDYEVSPDPSVWKNIEGRLMKKKKRRIIPLWLRIGGAAAIMLLLVSTGFWVYNQNTNTKELPNEIIITDTDSKDKIIENEPSIKEEEIVTFEEGKETIEENRQNKNSIAKTNQSPNPKTNTLVEKLVTIEKQSKTAPQENKNIAISKDRKKEILPELEKQTPTEIDKIAAIVNENQESEKAAVAQEEKGEEQMNAKVDIQQEIEKITKEETVAKNTTNKWSIGSTMAPVYYNTLSNGSPIDPALANNDKRSNSSISYGLKVNYKLSDKLSLQSGINTVELGYSTKNVTVLLSSSLLDGSTTNINTNINRVSVAALSTSSQSSETLSRSSSFDLSGDLEQTLNYVEVPIEAKYNILQKKLGVNLIGGFSTYFLYQNRVSINSFDTTSALGEASNINSLNFSGNLGVDFDYNISKKLYINVSPMFKYQFNTFSENSGGFKPYYLGVYTGLNFRF